jgi:hypothetical protein
MRRHLQSVDEVSAAILRGEPLLLAGDERVLRQLPRGDWIGGTTPYFQAEAGCLVDREHVFVDAVPPGLRFSAIRQYREQELGRLYLDLPEDGVGIVITPAGTPVTLAFARAAPRLEGFARRPLIGWASGVHLDELGRAAPLAFDGTSAEALPDRLVVMQLALAPGASVQVDLVNIFMQGDGPPIVFPESGFSARDAEIGGRRQNLAHYVTAHGLDTQLPLVADSAGASINVAFQTVDPARGEVAFYGPVFADLTYRHARPVGDYVDAFLARAPRGLGDKVAFSCSCILNYLYSQLEGRRAGDVTGPITFGEIAYQLLNQTMVYLVVDR